jgi:hypothetical protein
LQDAAADLEARGIGLAAISYDSPSTLKAFADARAITFPLLSDAGSATITQYGLLNRGATGRAAGIPHPGTFVLDARGTVTARSFESAYQERASAAAIVGAAAPNGRSGARTETAHVAVGTSASNTRVAPGTRIALYVDVAPRPKMHVYAPEQPEMIPVSLSLHAADVKIHPPRFPAPETYFFKPLNETQLVYSKPFRIVQEVTVALTPAVRERARADGATLTITGTLQYQACDDAICYAPVTVPVAWTLGLRPLER